MKRDDTENEPSQEALDPEQHGEKVNVLSIAGRINAKRNAPERIYICRAEVKRDRNDEDGQH